MDEQLKKHEKQVQLMKMLKNKGGLDYVPMHTARKTQKHPKKKQPQDTDRGPEPDRSMMFRSFSDREGLDDMIPGND